MKNLPNLQELDQAIAYALTEIDQTYQDFKRIEICGIPEYIIFTNGEELGRIKLGPGSDLFGPSIKLMSTGIRRGDYDSHALFISIYKKIQNDIDLKWGKGRFSWIREKLSKKELIHQSHRDSGHFHFSYADREQIVKSFRDARNKGQVINKEYWAKNNHGICARTLLNYEREFPETET